MRRFNENSQLVQSFHVNHVADVNVITRAALPCELRLYLSGGNLHRGTCGLAQPGCEFDSFARYGDGTFGKTTWQINQVITKRQTSIADAGTGLCETQLYMSRPSSFDPLACATHS